MSHKLSTVVSFGTIAEAAIARSCIEAEGIPVYITDEGMSWYYGTAVGGVKLQVEQAHLAQAISAIEESHQITISDSDWQS